MTLFPSLRAVAKSFAHPSRSRAWPRWATLLAVASVLQGTAWAQTLGQAASVVTTPQVRAELLAHAPQGVGPGQPLWLGLQITHQPGWHTYWKNPGDSGLPTRLEWTLPAGIDAGEIAWPLPKRIPIGQLANYGYENTVLLPVPVRVADTFRPDVFSSNPNLSIKLKAAWLVCKLECIPEEGEFSLQLPLRSSVAAQAQAFEAAWTAQPQALDAQASAGSRAQPTAAQRIDIRVSGLPAPLRGKALALYPETPEIIDNVKPPTQSWDGEVWTASIALAQFRSAEPSTLPVVLTLQGGREASNALPAGWRVELPVQGAWPAPPPRASTLPAFGPVQAAPGGQLSAPDSPSLGLWGAIAAALIGGLLLNLMPCVFPMLAIKMVALSQPASAAQRRVQGLAYTAGVMLTLLALAGALLALRAAGEQLGWGFQLQSPAVVAALAVLFTVIGLNLSGLFDFGRMVPSGLGGLQLSHPLLNQALSGALSVVLSSPCTAPFMGASLGLAMTLPAGQALGIFAALGVGMAAPYLAATLVPALARAMPKPGAWMNVLRQALAFPMFATVVWLLWVLGQQSGIDGAAALLAILLSLSALLWALRLSGRSRAVALVLTLGILVALSTALLPRVVSQADPLSADGAGNAGKSAGNASPTAWQAWHASAVQERLGQGQAVFVDFTAAWCVTCQLNKQTTLTDAALLAEFGQRKVALLRADWTRRDPAITAALAQLGRSGIPVYALYRPGQPPVILSELISVADVRRALATLGPL